MTDVRDQHRPPTEHADTPSRRRGRTWDRSRGFLFTNHVTNPALICVLGSRFGTRLGRSLAVVRYTGHRTGIPRRLVAQYRCSGDTVTITVMAERRKQWWRNFTTPGPIELVLAGTTRRGTAHASKDELGAMTVTVQLDSEPAP